MTAPAWSDSTVKSTIASGPRRCLQNLLVIRLSLVPFAAVAAATIVIGIFDTAYAGSVDSGMDAALIGGGAALLFAVFVAVISVHLLSQHIKRVMSSVDSLSDEQLAMAASGTRETTRTLTQRLLRAIRPVEEIDRELVQRRRSQQLLERYFERDQLYAAVVRSANDAIITKTLEGRITAWNPAAEQLFGYKAEEVIGRSIDIIIPPERRGDLHHILERIGRGEYIEHFDTVRTTKDGRFARSVAQHLAGQVGDRRDHRFRQSRARHDRAEAAARTRIACAEDGGRRVDGRRCRARFQQSPARHDDPRRDDA
jgi:PAS domain S-box-containing protein